MEEVCTPPPPNQDWALSRQEEDPLDPTMLLLLYLSFLIFPLFAQRLKHIFVLPFSSHLCSYGPCVTKNRMCSPNQVLERDQIGCRVSYLLRYDQTCNPHNNSCYAVLLKWSLSLLPFIFLVVMFESDFVLKKIDAFKIRFWIVDAVFFQEQNPLFWWSDMFQ